MKTVPDLKDPKQVRAFTLAVQAAGLSLRSVSFGAVGVLRRLAKQPVAMRQRHDRSTPTEVSKMLGPLIRHGLAQFEREAERYAITDKGREYLDKLDKAGLLWKEAEPCKA
jgi:hypothetical protein